MQRARSRSSFLGLVGAGVAVPAVTSMRAAGAQEREHIRIAGVPSDDMTPVYYALKNGLYERAGLDVEVVPTSSGSAATTAVVAGTYEMGKGSPIASVLAHLRGLPLVVVANSVIWDARRPFNVIAVAADAPFATGADLNGKIASTPGLNDINQLAITAWVDKNGGDAKTLRWIELPLSAAPAALAEHRVDVCALLEPVLTAALETGKVRVLTPGFNAIANRFTIGLYMANADWAAKHPDAVRRWVRVTYDAGAYTNAHHAQTVDMMSEITKIPLAVYPKIVRAEAGTRATSDPALLQPLIDAAAAYKQLPRAIAAKELFFTG